MKDILRIRFGSHLYGTSTPTSDEDWKGVFVPETRDVLLGHIPKTANSERGQDGVKNAPGELDLENYSLHHFVRLAVQGQTVALDMLFAPASLTVRGPHVYIWDEIQKERHRFISKSMNAFIGYARSQAAKYSLKGDRLNKLRAFHDIVNVYALKTHGEGRMADIWDRLERDDERRNPQGIRELQIAGKWFGETTEAWLVQDSLEGLIKRYGNRTQSAADAGGIDWKALSHAVRVSMELEDLLRDGEIMFPLPYASLLLNIKQGRESLENVQRLIDDSLTRVEELAASSGLPEKVNSKWWDDWLVKIMSSEIVS
jgi:hypothetical protein